MPALARKARESRAEAQGDGGDRVGTARPNRPASNFFRPQLLVGVVADAQSWSVQTQTLGIDHVAGRPLFFQVRPYGPVDAVAGRLIYAKGRRCEMDAGSGPPSITERRITPQVPTKDGGWRCSLLH